MVNNLIKVLFIVLIMGILVSCGVCPTPSSLPELQKPFGISPDEKQVLPQNYNIFIDVSGSMKGFVSQESEFLNIINTLISLIPDTNQENQALSEHVRFFTFGKTINPLKGDLKSSLHTIADPNIYNQNITDLNNPFEYIFGDQRSVNLIITDGVQSTHFAGQDQVIFSKNLKKYLGDNGFFSFMGKQVSFEGRYPTEKTGKTIVLEHGGKRPLYCLVFGNRKYSEFINKKISDLFDEHFDFGNMTPNNLRFYQRKDGSTDASKLQHLGDDLRLPLTKYEFKGFTKDLSFYLKGYEDRLGKIIDYRIAYISKTDSTYQQIYKSEKALTASTSDTGDYLSFTMPFQYEKKGCYLIRITFRKTLPQWIIAWDTNDDSKIDNQNKTYRLKPWMESILNSFDDYEFLSTTQYYLHVTRK